MKKLSVFLITPLTLLGMSESGYADSLKMTNPENEHLYQRIDTSMTWRDAKRYCDNQGGYLATITSQTENDFVYFQVVTGGQTFWLGGTDRDAEGQWEWITGETWEYTNWSSAISSLAANPNNDGKGQDYLTFWDAVPSKWDDAGLPHLDVLEPFICEWGGDVSVATYTQADMDTAKAEEYESGRQSCITDPLSCGISVSSVAATFSPKDNLLRIPSIEVPGPFGQVLFYSGDMLLTPSDTPFGFHFEIQALEQTQ
jgi:hypothetical protein